MDFSGVAPFVSEYNTGLVNVYAKYRNCIQFYLCGTLQIAQVNRYFMEHPWFNFGYIIKYGLYHLHMMAED